MTPITIRHNHTTGTSIEGSTKGDGILDAVRSLGFRAISDGLRIPGTRDTWSNPGTLRTIAARVSELGFTPTIEVDDTWRPAAVRYAEREQRATDRADRYEHRADRAAGRAEQAEAVARQTLDRIPFGQPVLTDHYSARSDIRRRERAWAQQDRARTEEAYADDLDHRAKATRNNEAYKHNPAAMVRKIEELEADVRRADRTLASSYIQGDTDWRERVEGQRARDVEEIAWLRAQIDGLATPAGPVVWGREHFQTGDKVLHLGIWYPVRKVNKKSLSVPGGYSLTGRTDTTWSDLIKFDKVNGRRRDGMQLDAPNGVEWPEADARRVSRWTQWYQTAARSQQSTAEGRDLVWRVQAAMRIVHGLPLTAGEQEVAAFAPDPADTDAVRAYAITYHDMAVRLAAADQARREAGGTQADMVATIVAEVTPIGTPTWRVPAGDGTTVRVDRLHPGDIIAGVYDRGTTSTEYRNFVGVVQEVSNVVNRHERGTFVTITLADGTMRDFATHIWTRAFTAAQG
jgi:hypothetical protein